MKLNEKPLNEKKLNEMISHDNLGIREPQSKLVEELLVRISNQLAELQPKKQEDRNEIKDFLVGLMGLFFLLGLLFTFFSCLFG